MAYNQGAAHCIELLTINSNLQLIYNMLSKFKLINIHTNCDSMSDFQLVLNQLHLQVIDMSGFTLASNGGHYRDLDP